MHNPKRMGKWLAALLFLSNLVIVSPPEARAAPVLLGVEFSGQVVRIDDTTGAGTPLGPSGFTRLNSLAANPAGTLLYSVGNSGGAVDNALVRIDPASGAGTLIATLSLAGAADVRILSLALGPDGFLYGENRAGANILDPKTFWRINPSTGAATLIANLASNVGLQGLDFATDGTLYGWEVTSIVAGGSGIGLCKVNPATGALTDVNPAVNGTPDLQTICFLPDGRLVGGGAARFYTVNSATGTPTFVGGSNYTDLRGLAVVPEPATVVCVAGAAVIAAMCRRRCLSR